jgi:hypothetical protein
LARAKRCVRVSVGVRQTQAALVGLQMGAGRHDERDHASPRATRQRVNSREQRSPHGGHPTTWWTPSREQTRVNSRERRSQSLPDKVKDRFFRADSACGEAAVLEWLADPARADACCERRSCSAGIGRGLARSSTSTT